MKLKTKPQLSEQMIIGIGFFLIILVALFTVFRSVSFKKTPTHLSGTPNAANTEKYDTISTQDLQKKIISEKDNFILLDVRAASAFMEEHVLDALNIPVDDLEKSASLPADKQIFLLAENSQDEAIAKALAILKQKNLNNVTVLAGGMESWKNLGGQTVTSGDPSLFVNQAKVYFIEAEKLKDNLSNNKIFIIDARPNADFAQGHLRNADNIPFEELEKRRNEIPTSKTIAVYDADEVQGFQSAARIYDLVGMPAYDLRGGFKNWQEKNFEIVK